MTAAALVCGLVLAVIDGDTLRMDVAVWPGTTVRTLVRVDGVDTPEMRGKCDAERVAARRAQEAIEARIASDGTACLGDVRPGKYAGRVVARVVLEGVPDLARWLIAEGYGRPYSGGKRGGWCE